MVSNTLHGSKVNALLIVCCHGNSLVHSHQYVWADELALPQQSSVLSQLLQLHLCHGHERINFMLRALEVLYAECIDGDNLDASFVADFEDLVAMLA